MMLVYYTIIGEPNKNKKVFKVIGNKCGLFGPMSGLQLNANIL